MLFTFTITHIELIIIPRIPLNIIMNLNNYIKIINDRFVFIND